MADTTHARVTPTGAAALAQYLEGRGATFELIEHPETMSAAAEADAAGWSQERVAKTVVLHDGSAYLLAILPASERLDLHKLREFVGSGRQVRLATEDEIARDFPTLTVGATPPVGPMLPRAEVVDRRLMEQTTILCAGGDHTHAVAIAPTELVRLTDAKVADIAVD